jgi:Legionella pneumophila major outer membrane protein precursor
MTLRHHPSLFSLLRLFSLYTLLVSVSSASGQSAAVPPIAPAPAPPPPVPTLGQPVPLPPDGTPYVPPTPTPPGPPSPLAPAPAVLPVFPPAPGAPTPGPGSWGPYAQPNRVDGFYALVDLDILKPRFHNGMSSSNPLGLSTGAVGVPTASLPWTVAPTFEGGYRLPDNQGYFALSYRFLTTSGNSSPTIDDLPVNVSTRLDINEIVFDYGFVPYEFYPRWVLNSRVGIQFDSIFFDSTVSNPTYFEQSGSNFYGAGPHLRFDVARHIVPVPGLDLFGRLDGAVLFGQNKQHYRLGSASGDGEETRFSGTVPILTLRIGLAYTPEFAPNLHLSTGYQFQDYWSLGSIGLMPDGMSPTRRASLDTQGVFIQGVLDF